MTAICVMVSMEPAVAALVAWAFLNERLSPTQWLAIILVMSASMGCVWTAQRRR
ncbi:MAG: EamA family transporter [Lautropia sp.]|nr:EamA family transporter [Lautropia sp.]